MAKTESNNLPKILLLVGAIVVAIALVIWKGGGAVGSNPEEVSFTPKVKAKGDGEFVRTSPGASTGAEDKTGAGD
ncbi:hypothetical protein EON81_00660 [bacterium]|nr:MAG: hypothetical protein EON81_00660 [bacterium]